MAAQSQSPQAQSNQQQSGGGSSSRPSYFSGNTQTHGQATLKFFLIIVVYAAFHWFVDYQLFQFTNSIPRVLLHLLFAIFFSSLYLNEGSRPATIKVLAFVAFFNYLISFIIYSFIPITVRFGSPEFFAGILLLILVINKPTLFSRDLHENPFSPAVLICFIASAYFLPSVTGLAVSLSAYSFFVVFLKYFTPFFFPIWLYYFFFGQPASQASGWARILIVVLFIGFLSPLWAGPLATSFTNSSGNGVSESQKDTFVNYLMEATDKSLLFGRTFTNSTVTSITCAYYSFTNQLNSVTGQTTTDPKYAMCLKSSTGPGVDEFQSSVERGALSMSSMTLGSVTAAQQKYYRGQDATFLTTFKATSFDTPVTVSPACTYSATALSDTKFSGVMTSSNFTIEGSAARDLVCTIPAGSLDWGKSYEYVTSVTFNYVTSAYLTRYFTTTEALATFAPSTMSSSDGLLSFYSVSDKQPISKSTKGPIKVGMNAESGLIVLSPAGNPNPKEFTVVVTIENQNTWKGKIQEVQSVLLTLPKGIELKDRRARIAKPVAPKGATNLIEPTWSDYDCSVGAFVGNFQKLNGESDSLQQINASAIYGELDYAHYNYYILVPGYGSGKTAVAVTSGLESTQKSFVSCQAVADNAQSLFPKNANFVIKSLQSRVSYLYELQQSRSFMVEAKTAGEVSNYADSMLMTKSFCGSQNAYTLTPNLGLTFFQSGTRLTDSSYSKNYDTYLSEVQRVLATLPEELKAFNEAGCYEKSIMMAIIMDDWSQVQSNPMISGYTYGYLRANKGMLTYLKSKGTDPQYSSVDATTPAAIKGAGQLLNDSALLDTFMREHYITLPLAYLTYLRLDCLNSQGGKDDVACVIGKYKCGLGYLPGNYNLCAVSNCQYCEQKTTTDVLSYATQVSQIINVSSQLPSNGGTI